MPTALRERTATATSASFSNKFHPTSLTINESATQLRGTNSSTGGARNLAVLVPQEELVEVRVRVHHARDLLSQSVSQQASQILSLSVSYQASRVRVWGASRSRSVEDLGFRVGGSGFRVGGLEFMGWGLGFRVQGVGLRV